MRARASELPSYQSARLKLKLFNHSLHTYITEEVDEGVVAGVGHGEPVAAEPDDVDVRITEILQSIMTHGVDKNVVFHCLWLKRID